MEDKEMSFLGHIGELRKHLIRIIIAIAVTSLVIGYNIRFFMDEFVLAPTKNNFITNRIINKISHYFHLPFKMNIETQFDIQTRKLYEEFNLTIQVAVIGGVIFASPYIIYEIWKFITPALKPNERKNASGYIVGTSFFFLLGCTFGYLVLAPMMVQFGINYRATSLSKKYIELSDIITKIINSVFGMGVVFLLPVITYALTAAGIITPTFLKTYRKHAVVVILTISAIITPPDAISMFLGAIPLYFLYEFSVYISKIVYLRTLK